MPEDNKNTEKQCDIHVVVGRREQLICPICGLDGFEDQADLDIHLEECEDIDY